MKKGNLRYSPLPNEAQVATSLATLTRVHLEAANTSHPGSSESAMMKLFRKWEAAYNGPGLADDDTTISDIEAEMHRTDINSITDFAALLIAETAYGGFNLSEDKGLLPRCILMVSADSAETPNTADPLLDAIEAYRTGFQAFCAVPESELVKDEQGIVDATYRKPLDVLIYWEQPAITPEGAIEALRLVKEEDMLNGSLGDALLSAAVGYLENHSGSVGTSPGDTAAKVEVASIERLIANHKEALAEHDRLFHLNDNGLAPEEVVFEVLNTADDALVALCAIRPLTIEGQRLRKEYLCSRIINDTEGNNGLMRRVCAAFLA